MGSLTCVYCKAALPRPGARCRKCGWAQDYNPQSSQRNRKVVLLLTLALVAVATGFVAFFGLLLAR
jgi:predicted nucleic acid-binding Zn ribbon protein